MQALRESLAQESERIFRLMKILYPAHDMHSAFVGIQSADPGVHDNALEFLDNVLPRTLRALVVPLFDRAIAPAKRARASPTGWSGWPWARATRPWRCWRSEPRSLAAVVRRLRHRRVAPRGPGPARGYGAAIDADPLLRATALRPRAKLKDHAAMPPVDVG